MSQLGGKKRIARLDDPFFFLQAEKRGIPGRLYKSFALSSQETRGSGKGLRDEAERWKDEGLGREARAVGAKLK